mgnify:CR=1 FL=1
MAKHGNFGRLHGNRPNFYGLADCANLVGIPWGMCGAKIMQILRAVFDMHENAPMCLLSGTPLPLT